MTALVRWVLGFIFAFFLAPRVEASIPLSTHQPAGRIFGYDSRARRHRPLRQSEGGADCGLLRPCEAVGKTALRRAGSFAYSVLQFTGKERDGETGLDYFVHRFMSSPLGRFTSLDPGSAGARVDEPQSWNGYSYAGNNPLLYTDPLGLDYHVCDAHGQNCRVISDDEFYVSKSGLIVKADGTILAKNDDGSTTRVGTATYFNEKVYSALQRAGERASRDISTSAILIGGFAAAYSSTYLGPALFTASVGSEAGVFVFGKGFELVRDGTGNVHGDLPKFVPRGLTREQLELAAQELRASIKVRNEGMIRLSEQGNHGLRLSQEQQLLRQIERRLSSK